MEHVLDWLQAYHDGELEGRQARHVEEHLAQCAPCRTELETLRAFSALLHESPAASDLMRPDRFVAQVELRLPPRPAKTAAQRALETGWRLIPVGLFGAWAFVQAVFIVVAGVLLAQGLPFTADLFAAVLPPVSGVSWLAAGQQCFTDTGLGIVWCVADVVASLRWVLIVGFAPLVVIGLLYVGWLAGWWFRQQRRVVYVQ